MKKISLFNFIFLFASINTFSLLISSCNNNNNKDNDGHVTEKINSDNIKVDSIKCASQWYFSNQRFRHMGEFVKYIKKHTNIDDISKYDLNLIGKIKTLKEFTFYAIDNFGSIEKGKRYINENDKYILFNEKGKKLEEYFYSLDFKMSKDIFSSRYSNKDTFFENNPILKRIFSYDEKGNKTEENWFRYDNGFYMKSIFKYNDNGKLIEENIYDFNGSPYIKVTYKYNNNGVKIEIDLLNSEYTLFQKKIYKYNYNGNIIVSIIEKPYNFISDSLRLSETKIYNNKGYLIEESDTSAQDFLSYIKKYKYDSKGNLIEKKEYDYNGKLKEGEYTKDFIIYDNYSIKYKYDFDFDKKGNWIKKIEYHNEKPCYYVEREIEYFDL